MDFSLRDIAAELIWCPVAKGTISFMSSIIVCIWGQLKQFHLHWTNLTEDIQTSVSYIVFRSHSICCHEFLLFVFTFYAVLLFFSCIFFISMCLSWHISNILLLYYVLQISMIDSVLIHYINTQLHANHHC